MSPTYGYYDRRGLAWERLLLRGGLLLATVAAVGVLAGWTKWVRAADVPAMPNASFLARQMGSLNYQLETARGEMAVIKLQLERANAILDNSTKYQIPADLAADIYDIALSEGIDPALGFQLVKIESSFKGDARSPMDALGYTQVQLATARFYDRDVTAKELMRRETNLRIGFRFLNDLLGRFDHNMQLALLAYNRGPAKVAEILAAGGNPANGYDALVLKGYRAPKR
jgi:soluble lytic murein transglycosylase-like protein